VAWAGEGRKPGVFMNPRVIPTCIAFWPGEKELNLHIKHTTLEPKYNQLFLNLGRVSHECQNYQFLLENVTKDRRDIFQRESYQRVFNESRSFT
jgi:hypothetical protein